MAADGVGILQHDLAMDVFDGFFESFDNLITPTKIVADLTERFAFDNLDDCEKEVFLTAVIECLWRVGESTVTYEAAVSALQGNQDSKVYWGDLAQKRSRAVQSLLRKVKTRKSKPRTPRATPKSRKPILRVGDFVLYRRTNGKFVVTILWFIEGSTYYFGLPKITKDMEPALTAKLLSCTDCFTESDFKAYFPKRNTVRLAAIQQKIVRANKERFRVIRNQALPNSGWSFVGNSLTAENLVEFENQLNGNGSRSFSGPEVAGYISLE